MRDATSISQAAPAVANLEQHVRDLVAEGAHDILPNLPNLGRIPESIAAGQATIDLRESLSLAADRLENDLLIELYRLDVFTAMEALTRDGEAFGFTNVTLPCGNVDGPCVGDLFWDEIHPTTAGHEFLGHAALSLLLGSPLGDLSGDGMINLGDVPAMMLALTDRAGYDTAYPTVDADIAGDIDNSGSFDLGDLRSFAAMFEPSAATALSVPEPSALILTALMLAGLMPRQIS